MINQLVESLEKGESMTLNLSRDDKGRACVILSASIELDPDDSDEARRQLRAAIAQPLVLRLDDGEDCDEQLGVAISTYATEQRGARDSLASYKASMTASRASAETAASKKDSGEAGKKKGTVAVDDKPASDKPAENVSEGDSNPDSLF